MDGWPPTIKKSTGAVLQSYIKPLNANKPTPRYYTFVSLSFRVVSVYASQTVCSIQAKLGL